MPFTLAHPAIVLPFLKSRARLVSATGLVFGSVAPDFEYFFKMHVNSEYSHSLSGLFYFDIPVTLLVAFLFHQLVRNNLIDNLPPFFQRRLSELRKFEFIPYLRRNFLVFLFCAMVGAASHIFWDNFTHADGYFVHRLPFYARVVPYDGVRYPMFYALQHISTAIGLLAVVLYIIFLKPDPTVNVLKPRLLYWTIINLLSVLILFLRFGLPPSDLSLGNFVVSLLAAIGCSLVAAGLMKFRQEAPQPVSHG